MRTVSPVDAAWLVLESRDTPMHVGGLFEFTLPPNAPADYLKNEFDRWRAPQTIPPPWNLRLVEGPLLGPRLPLMREVRDVDLDYHIRHSALPHPGGQRELGVLVSRLRRSTSVRCRLPTGRPTPCLAGTSPASAALPPSSTTWTRSRRWRARASARSTTSCSI